MPDGHAVDVWIVLARGGVRHENLYLLAGSNIHELEPATGPFQLWYEITSLHDFTSSFIKYL